MSPWVFRTTRVVKRGCRYGWRSYGVGMRISCREWMIANHDRVSSKGDDRFTRVRWTRFHGLSAIQCRCKWKMIGSAYENNHHASLSASWQVYWSGPYRSVALKDSPFDPHAHLAIIPSAYTLWCLKHSEWVWITNLFLKNMLDWTKEDKKRIEFLNRPWIPPWGCYRIYTVESFQMRV